MMRALALLVCLLLPLGSAVALDRLITVTGEGTVSVPPDMATIHLGVTTQAASAREASDANARRMTALLTAMKGGGIAESDIQTSSLSLQPQMGGGNTPRITGFQASNQVMVKVRDLAALSGLLDKTIAAGANDVSGIEFAVSDRSKALDRARKDAIDDARRKAELYATAAGAKVGAVALISETSHHTPVRPMMRTMREAAAVPIEPGEQKLQVSVTVSYELAQ
jgi:uncharacterized protein YggE